MEPRDIRALALRQIVWIAAVIVVVIILTPVLLRTIPPSRIAGAPAPLQTAIYHFVPTPTYTPSLSPQPTVTGTPTSTSTPRPTRTPWPSHTPTATTTASPSSLPPTSTHTMTPPAADLPPYFAYFGENARDIFEEGQKLGNRPRAFSKVGDSITVDPHFLTQITEPGAHLGEYAALADTVAYFGAADVRGSDPFAVRSLAAGVGWLARDLLDPMRAACGKTPLECEYDLTRPAIALIMIGTNDAGVGVFPEEYARDLEEIVAITLERGIVPVLSTIPHSQWRDVTDFNAAIRRIAAAGGLPLIDYYAAMSSLPDRGMSPDGVHPSVPPDGNAARFTRENLRYGYTLRTLLALQALDALRDILGLSD